MWARVSDAPRLHEWFPGMESSEVNDGVRTITLASGMALPEEILVVDHAARCGLGVRLGHRVTPSWCLVTSTT